MNVTSFVFVCVCVCFFVVFCFVLKRKEKKIWNKNKKRPIVRDRIREKESNKYVISCLLMLAFFVRSNSEILVFKTDEKKRTSPLTRNRFNGQILKINPLNLNPSN